jgi:hypothetical protein
LMNERENDKQKEIFTFCRDNFSYKITFLNNTTFLLGIIVPLDIIIFHSL